MTTFTIYAGATDGYISSSNATYATARSGGTLSANTAGANIIVGQQRIGGINYVLEGYLEFDTSAVGPGATVTSSTLAIKGNNDKSATDFTLEAWSRDWGGGTLTTGDYVAGASLSGLTLLASALSSNFIFGAYNTFASDAAFLAAINLTGYTRILVASDLTRTNTAPTGDEYTSYDSADVSGTSSDPRLIIIATLPITGAAAITEADDTVSSAGTVAIAGAAAITEAGDIVQSSVITAAPGSINVKYAGAWQVPTVWVKRSGAWVQPVAGHVKTGGVWKRVL